MSLTNCQLFNNWRAREVGLPVSTLADEVERARAPVSVLADEIDLEVEH